MRRGLNGTKTKVVGSITGFIFNGEEWVENPGENRIVDSSMTR